MKTKLKYSLILVSTLVIGMVIGFLIGGRITSTRIDNMRSYYTNNGFNRQLGRIIQPTPEQHEQIRPILRKHAEINRQQMTNFRIGQEKEFKELIYELEEHLNKDQIKRLTHYLEKRDKRTKNDSFHHSKMEKRKRSNRK